MKTTVEIPDALFRRAKAEAARQGKSLKDFFSEAVRARLESAPAASPGALLDQPWMQGFGALKHLHRENRRIDRIIREAFETIDEEQWQQ